MAGAGGVALGAGAVLAAEHAGDIGRFAEGAFDDMGRFAGEGETPQGLVGRVTGFELSNAWTSLRLHLDRYPGDAAHGVEEFVEDIF